jgi:hypothetical protein
MKTKISLAIVVIIAAIAFVSCAKTKKDNTTPTAEQATLLEKMNVAYSNSKTYDNSLIQCLAASVIDSALMHQMDSCYHANDNVFMNCHNSMMSTTGGMMSGTGGMMGGTGGMMGNDPAHNTCTTNNPEFNQLMLNMEQLRQTHAYHHPHQ